MFKEKFYGWICEKVALLKKPSNTLGADVNEIMLGYILLGNTWAGFQNGKEARNQIKLRQTQLSKDEFDVQVKRAQVMAQVILKWAKSNGYRGSVKKV